MPSSCSPAPFGSLWSGCLADAGRIAEERALDAGRRSYADVGRPIPYAGAEVGRCDDLKGTTEQASSGVRVPIESAASVATNAQGSQSHCLSAATGRCRGDAAAENGRAS